MRRLPLLFLRPASSLVFLCLGAGCAADRSPKTTAYLVGKEPVWVVSIDDRAVSHSGFGKEKRYEISPGAHRVTVAFSEIQSQEVNDEFLDNPMPRSPAGTLNRRPPRRVVTKIHSTENVELPFTAEPGRTYYLKSGLTETHWQPHISESRDPVFMDPPPR
jgi:hypothetical protein